MPNSLPLLLLISANLPLRSERVLVIRPPGMVLTSAYSYFSASLVVFTRAATPNTVLPSLSAI